jgi:hypothetical protein
MTDGLDQKIRVMVFELSQLDTAKCKPILFNSKQIRTIVNASILSPLSVNTSILTSLSVSAYIMLNPKSLYSCEISYFYVFSSILASYIYKFIQISLIHVS